MDSQIREIRGGFADIRNGFASRFAWIRTRFAKIRRYSRRQYAKIRKDSHEFAIVSQGSHVYAHCESEEEPLLTTHLSLALPRGQRQVERSGFMVMGV